jgi:hypothetical protein
MLDTECRYLTPPLGPPRPAQIGITGRGPMPPGLVDVARRSHSTALGDSWCGIGAADGQDGRVLKASAG